VVLYFETMAHVLEEKLISSIEIPKLVTNSHRVAAIV
jgi:hypothetical protein